MCFRKAGRWAHREDTKEKAKKMTPRTNIVLDWPSGMPAREFMKRGAEALREHGLSSLASEFLHRCHFGDKDRTLDARIEFFAFA